VALGGNLMMNVGPTGRGVLDQRTRAALATYGEWMELNARAIYGCTQSEFVPPPGCRFTQNGNRLYLHIFDWPFRHLHLREIGHRVAYAQFLHDASEILTLDPNKQTGYIGVPIAPGSIVLDLPVRHPDVTIPVVELFLKD